MKLKMKPIILITIYNRFHELAQHLIHNNSLFNEFDEKPYVIVVWAAPKSEYLYLFEDFIKNGLVDKLLFREKTDLDGGPTTFTETLNLNIGFDYIKDNFVEGEYFIIGQSADIKVNQGTYKLINDNIKTNNAVLFFWENGIARENVWHTNFFAVKNLQYLPPVNTPMDSDVLETKYGKYLLNNNLNSFLRSHNSRSKKFQHLHLTESLPEIQKINNVRCISIKKDFEIIKEKWYIRFYKFIRSFL